MKSRCWRGKTPVALVAAVLAAWGAFSFNGVKAYAQESETKQETEQEEQLPPALAEYRGRQIAPTMHYAHAGWLLRPEREQEESCTELLKLLNIQPGQVVADIGCGNGFYTLPMAEQTGEKGKVHAVDIQSEMLRMLEDRAKEKGLKNIELIHGTPIDPRLPKESIDVALLVDVYHEFSHPEHMLKALRDSLKPDGQIVLVEFRGEDPDVPILPLHKMTKKQIKKEFFPAGFKIVKEDDSLPWQHVMWLGKSDGEETANQNGPVTVGEETLFGDLVCFRIATPTATYLYGKQGAGFASILDSEGNDWISYRHGGKAAGEYRGLPKCGQPIKYFHCGYGFGQYKNENPFVSKIETETPEHVRIVSETKNGDSACVWDFYPTHATLTLNKIGNEAYWFLYEGTPGGTLDSEDDFVVRPGNKRTPLSEPWLDNVPWVYFTAKESKSAFFLIDHQSDPGPESYVSWPYTKDDKLGQYQVMTVFGFGRPDWQDSKQHTPPLKSLPARFTIGFAQETNHYGIERVIGKVSE